MPNLPEELLLISLDDQKGSPYGVVTQTALRYGLAAALLADLALHRRICVEDQRVVLSPCDAGAEHLAGTTGDPLLDGALEQLSKADRSHKVKYWINALGFRKLPGRVTQGLVARGVLREEDHCYYGARPKPVYSEGDTPTKYWIKQGLRAAVLAGVPLERRQVVLLSLLRACRILNLIFTRDERKAAGKHVDQLVEGEDFGVALRQTLADIAVATSLAVAG